MSSSPIGRWHRDQLAIKETGDDQRSSYCSARIHVRGQGAGHAGACRGSLRRAPGEARRLAPLTETCAARRPAGRLELRNVVHYEPLDGLLGIWAAEAHVAHVRDVEPTRAPSCTNRYTPAASSILKLNYARCLIIRPSR